MDSQNDRNESEESYCLVLCVTCITYQLSCHPPTLHTSHTCTDTRHTFAHTHFWKILMWRGRVRYFIIWQQVLIGGGGGGASGIFTRTIVNTNKRSNIKYQNFITTNTFVSHMGVQKESIVFSCFHLIAKLMQQLNPEWFGCITILCYRWQLYSVTLILFSSGEKLRNLCRRLWP